MTEQWTYEDRLRAGQLLTELAKEAGRKGVDVEKAYAKVGEAMGDGVPIGERKSVTFFAQVRREGGYNKGARFIYNPDKIIPNVGPLINDDEGDQDEDEGYEELPNSGTAQAFSPGTAVPAPQAVIDDEETQDWVEYSGNLRVQVESLDPDDELSTVMRARQVWIKKQPRK